MRSEAAVGSAGRDRLQSRAPRRTNRDGPVAGRTPIGRSGLSVATVGVALWGPDRGGRRYRANRNALVLSSGPSNGGGSAPSAANPSSLSRRALYSTRLTPRHYQGHPVYFVPSVSELPERTWYDSE